MRDGEGRPEFPALLNAVCFLILVPLICHLLFSWMGFTPTDEGFTLAHSRRILDGQVPHRDFIMIRPVVSPLLHVPFVRWGGDDTFWLSRLFVWFQLATISWLWVSLFKRLLDWQLSVANTFLIALICFAATTHTKHLTAWHTIDGLFFIAIGFALCTRKQPASKFVGYLLVAIAALCKQNFIFVSLLSILVLGDWRRIRYWVAVVLPASCYTLYLFHTDALSDAVLQFRSHTELFPTGFLSYLNVWVGLGAAVFLIVRVSRTRLSGKANRALFVSLFYLLPLFAAAAGLWFGVAISGAFLLFGLLAMLAFQLLYFDHALDAEKRVIFLVLLTAWSASLSGGYNTPALMAGPILVALTSHALRRYNRKGDRVLRFSLPLAAVLILLGFRVARMNYIYREQPASRLRYSLDGVMPGAKGIYTNENTFHFLTDLNLAITIVQEQDKEYAILPDVAAHWVKAPQKNPLLAVWPQASELGSRALMMRFLQNMEARRNSTIFIVQKVEAKDLATGFVTLQNSDYYEAVRYVRTNFEKIRETNYFELYR